MSGAGNTLGRVVAAGELPAIEVTAANPAVKAETAAEKGVWGSISGWVHGGLDAVGLIPGLGAIPDLLNAGIYAAEGDYVNAGISAVAAIPVVGDAALAGKYAAKGGRLLAKEGERLAVKEGEKVAAKETEKVAAKGEKEAVEGSEKQGAKETEHEGGAGSEPSKGQERNKVQKKKKMKCGEYGRYSKLKKKTGENKFDRDHIPSKAALKERAKFLNDGQDLSAAQKKAIDDWGEAIAIPRQAHIDVSPTYGQTTAEAAKDAKNLASAARRDVEAMLGKIEEYDADGGCKKAYKKAASRIMRMDNQAFDDALIKILEKVQ
ncbi:hypothetical protein WJ95_31755 [Burkholderia ubonensis]|uniref:hypothetical protein n=1 Tax=Burkholderia ubonensis TaxID=101571 RepID=UPI0005D7EDE6|nr:hypothetical protein [Burkholderia ubonensis]AJX16044.1 hypothetical protein BW23_954 [Burkholderia ubonensis MSMB22]KVA71921.1 hypothetical protein WM36_25990 [Burkholderia ubonensis]KVD69595.1 hypothetical protein WI88_31810 [Burkholderia ubonensis]KVP98636.1 hypothetical protein WJ95_31755 [Burkholderia ubonensis]KVR50768.1 hypothetical protein WK18_05485 [Burkholderia ubonensis]